MMMMTQKNLRSIKRNERGVWNQACVVVLVDGAEQGSFTSLLLLGGK